MSKQVLILFVLLITCCAAYAQDGSVNDRKGINRTATDSNRRARPSRPAATEKTTAAEDDTVKVKKLFEPNPKKAGMYSSILPGLGQAYNRQYWKIPVVYAILGTAGYFIGYNYNQYSQFRQAYIYEIDGDPGTGAGQVDEAYALYDASDLQRLQNNYKKDLDIIVLLTSVGYALQIMDAIVSAHLRNFDISRDISMQMQPVLQNNYVGVGLVFNLK